MIRLVVMLSILAGCYADPDYGSSRFKCDETHGCPDGQTCIAGMCSPDPGAGDGGVSSVACGAETCGDGQKCCVGFAVAPRCIDLAMSCAGAAATCDGVEDCGGDPCCDSGSTIACGTTCTSRICREPSDCAVAQPMCCTSLTGAPWGRCGQFCP
ncbi:MAG: hypothetical protein H6Q90_3534 [Deltaproteobacteria bacterium]|nr:hypothetical protein [Deltaproteobacteria bacterium]